jgi:hypothetical protein
LDYTECSSKAPASFQIPPTEISSAIKQWKYSKSTNTCTLQFEVKQRIEKRISMYIRITNFYQNHRLYVKSLDPDQLKGKLYQKASDIPVSITNCGWLLHANCDVAKTIKFENGLTYAQNNPDCRTGVIPDIISNADRDAQYYPCGLIANSMFSDTISPVRCLGSNCITPEYEFTQTGIAWPEDAGLYARSSWATAKPFNETVSKFLVPPPQWRKGIIFLI